MEKHRVVTKFAAEVEELLREYTRAGWRTAMFRYQLNHYLCQQMPKLTTLKGGKIVVIIGSPLIR